MLKFVLVRHATSDWNLEGRVQGQTDRELAPQGWAEAKEMAAKLSALGINPIVSSDLKRAQQTATVIGKELGIPVVFDKRLRECKFGAIEGMTYEKAPESIRGGDFLNYDFRYCGGELGQHVFERQLALLKEYAIAGLEGPILLVGHGRSLNTLLFGFGYPPDLVRGEYRVLEYRKPGN